MWGFYGMWSCLGQEPPVGLAHVSSQKKMWEWALEEALGNSQEALEFPGGSRIPGNGMGLMG